MSIIAMIPVDTIGLLPASADIDIPKASIAHTLFPCDRCERDCWIGPEQLKVRRARRGYVAWCYFCIIEDMRRGVDFGNVVSLNPEADKIPRRT